MDYVIILILQLLGIAFHVMQKVISIGDKYDDKTPASVFRVFISEDWDTLIVSALVVILNIVAHYILINYAPPLAFVAWEYFMLSSFGAALFLGYAGQRVIYKYFGTTEKFIDNQINKIQ